MKTLSPSKGPKRGSSGSPAQSYDLKQTYEQYDAVLLLTHRRFGLPIQYTPDCGWQAEASGGCGDEASLLYRPSCRDSSRILPKDALSNSEAEFMALHAARMCSSLNTVRSAISTTENAAAPPARAGRSNSAASANELMAHFQSVSGANVHPSGANSVQPPPHHINVTASQAAPRSRSFSPIPQTSSMSVSPNAAGERRRTSSGGSARVPLSKFAKHRLGKVLADIILSCSAISEASGLSAAVATVVNDVPKLVLSSNSDSPSDSAHFSRNPSRASKHHHLRNPHEESAHSFIHGLVRNAKSFPGTDRLDDSAVPFLQFDALINSAEDLTAFDEEDGYLSSGGGAASREHSALGHRKYHHVVSGSHAHAHSGAGHHLQAHHHAHHAPHHHSQYQHNHPSHHSGIEAQPGGSLQSGSDTSVRHLQVPMHKHPSNASRGSAHGGKGDLPHSPSASLMFKPALSFTSVESPRSRRLPRSVSPPFNRASPGTPYSYIVDEARVQVFFQTLRDIKTMLSKGRFSTEKDFQELGLRYVVPGITLAFVSPTPHSTPYATYVPPALVAQPSDAPIALLPPPVVELPPQGGRYSAVSHRTSVAASDHMDPQSPLGLPPKNPSTEVLDYAGQVSRMSSFSVKRAAAVSPSCESLSIVENGQHKIVSLKEFPIFLAAVEQTMVDVDAATGAVYNLQQCCTQL